MKFIINSNTLLKNLQLVGGVLNTNNALPILENFLFDINKKQLKISASDLETTISTVVELENVEEGGKVAIPAKLLLEMVKTFPSEPLNFSIDNSNFAIEISSTNGKYKLSGENGEEFPKIPTVDATNSIEIESEILFNGIDKTLFSAGNDDLRPIMSGVLFELSSSGMTFVATDAHKLVKYHRKDAKSKKSSAIILPKKPLNLLKNIIVNVDEKIKLQFNDANAYFAFGSTEIICRLIDGKFPNYDAVIPKENPNKLTIDRQAFLTSIKRISIFSNKTTHQIRLKLTGSELVVSAEDLDFSNAANERLTCNYHGDDMEIGFNSKFLIEMLTNLEADNVELEMSAPNRAGILFPAEKTNKNEDLLMLVMPVMLNN
jgi:DNA polymerase III subunit beta